MAAQGRAAKERAAALAGAVQVVLGRVEPGVLGRVVQAVAARVAAVQAVPVVPAPLARQEVGAEQAAAQAALPAAGEYSDYGNSRLP